MFEFRFVCQKGNIELETSFRSNISLFCSYFHGDCQCVGWHILTTNSHYSNKDCICQKYGNALIIGFSLSFPYKAKGKILQIKMKWDKIVLSFVFVLCTILGLLEYKSFNVSRKIEANMFFSSWCSNERQVHNQINVLLTIMSQRTTHF